MSEPVSNAEIEDVLSSIRKLVSENAGAARRNDTAQDMPEKLVLTPAFRVDEGDEHDASAQGDAGAVVSLDGGGWTDGGPEAVEEAVAEAVEDWGGMQIGEAPAPDQPPAEDDSYKSELERRIAELEAVIARSAADFEPDGSESEPVPEAPMMVLHDVAAGQGQQAGPEPASVEAGEPAQAAAEVPEWWAEAAVQPDGSQEAAESGEAGADDAGEPAFEAAEAPDHEADMPGGAAQTAAATAQTADAWEDVEADDPAGADDEGEEAVLDEEALREMVARMVREELQGTVGERITHNVRRMVRREIARALALKDFE